MKFWCKGLLKSKFGLFFVPVCQRSTEDKSKFELSYHNWNTKRRIRKMVSFELGKEINKGVFI